MQWRGQGGGVRSVRREHEGLIRMRQKLTELTQPVYSAVFSGQFLVGKQSPNYSVRILSLTCVLPFIFILLHAARRAMAAAPLLPKRQRYCFTYILILSRTGIVGHGGVPLSPSPHLSLWLRCLCVGFFSTCFSRKKSQSHDHSALQRILNQPKLMGCQMRLIETLQEYDFDIEDYRAPATTFRMFSAEARLQEASNPADK